MSVKYEIICEYGEWYAFDVNNGDKSKPCRTPQEALASILINERSCLDVEYNEYECCSYCHPDGCPGHLTDDPVGIVIKGVSFWVDGFWGGDYPSINRPEDVEKAKNAIAYLEKMGVSSFED